MAKLFARMGSTTVSWEKESPEAAAPGDHSARPSSPVLRTYVLVTEELVMPPSKLIPSAVVSWIRTSLILRLVNGPVIQMPALTCLIHTPLMVDFCSPPPMPLTSAESTRSATWPKMAKLDRWTLVLGLGGRLP